MPSTPVVSIDPGSSFIKAATGQANVRFPSVAMEFPKRADGMIEVDKKAYIVGQEALLRQSRPRDVPHSGADYHGSDLQYVLICHAMRQLKVRSCEAFLVGLPYFLRHNRPARQRIIERLKNIAWTDDEGHHAIKVEEPHIVPQGGGALWGYLASHRKDGNQLICAIDIGGHTTDVFTLATGDTLVNDTEVQGSSGSIGVNVHFFYQRLADRLRRLPGTGLTDKTFSYYSLMDLIERGKFEMRHNGHVVDISQPYKETCAEFTEDLVKAARDTVGDRWSELDTILLTGGGSALMDPSVIDDSRVAWLNASSNVQGQLIFYREAQGDGSAEEAVA